jgi:hypothetical protein
MDMRALGLAGAIALAVLAGCNDDGSSGNAGAGAMGGVGGAAGGGVGGSAGGGVGGATGGVGGATGGVGGATGGVGGAAGVMAGTTGGTAGTMGGMTGGTAGTEAGSAGTMAMGDGGVTDSASCIASAAADGRTGACTECGCMKCLAEIMNCQDEACSSVVSCGQAAGCSGSDCYCGIGRDAIQCAIIGAEGPCMNEIATASGLVADGTCAANNECASPLSMLAMTDPDNAVQRARALSICSQGQRASAGSPPLVEPTPEIAGMCMTECSSADAGM